MSTKKKKPARRPPRRTVYDIALDHAEKRLAKAVDERTHHLMKLDELAREIPDLENKVAALKPAMEAVHASPVYASPTPAYTPTPPPGDAASRTMDQEEYLARFIPRSGRVTTAAPPTQSRPQPDGTSNDPDEFLGDVGGQEILS